MLHIIEIDIMAQMHPSEFGLLHIIFYLLSCIQVLSDFGLSKFISRSRVQFSTQHVRGTDYFLWVAWHMGATCTAEDNFNKETSAQTNKAPLKCGLLKKQVRWSFIIGEQEESNWNWSGTLPALCYLMPAGQFNVLYMNVIYHYAGRNVLGLCVRIVAGKKYYALVL